MARVSACLFSCKPAHRVKLCDRPKRLRQDLPARKVCPICNGSPFPKKKKEKGIQNRTDLPRRARPISSGPPFPNPKIGKGGPFKIGQAPQLPSFLMTSKFEHNTDLLRASVQQRESKCRTTENCDKDKKDKNYYEPIVKQSFLILLIMFLACGSRSKIDTIASGVSSPLNS